MTAHERPNHGTPLQRLIELALEEDVGSGDRTTQWTIDAGHRGRAAVVAKEDLVVAGSAVARDVFASVDGRLSVDVELADGASASSGAEVMSIEGSLAGILVAERTALNFLARLCGIATETRRFVQAVEGTGVRVVDTRKTTPGWRSLEKAAVRAGGGENHRMGLYDMVMIKDNHQAAVGGAEEAMRRIRSRNGEGLPVEVEVATLEELEIALTLGADRILLDNMDLPTLRRAVRRVRSGGGVAPELEASGNVTLETVRSVAETGVDLVSVGALTHSAPAADLSLRVVS